MNSTLLKIVLVIFVALFVIDFAIMMTIRPFDIEPAALKKIFTVGGTLTLVFFAGFYSKSRLANGGQTEAPKLLHISEALMSISLAAGFVIVASALMAVLNYILMGTAFTLWDDKFASVDQAIGFDWIALLEWMEERPTLSWILVKAYSTSFVQVLSVIFIYSLMRRMDRVLEFIALYAITGTLVAIVSMLLPAFGAHFYYQPDPVLFDQYSKLGYVHIETLQQLRAGTYGSLGFETVVGMVSFPSFHTILAIIVTYSVRDNRILFVPVAVLNCFVVMSTLTEGGHYLVDIFGGTFISLVVILIVRAIAPNEREAASEPVYSRA